MPRRGGATKDRPQCAVKDTTARSCQGTVITGLTLRRPHVIAQIMLRRSPDVGRRELRSIAPKRLIRPTAQGRDVILLRRGILLSDHDLTTQPAD